MEGWGVSEKWWQEKEFYMTGVGRETRFSNTTSHRISAVKLFTTFQDLVPKWCRYTNPLTHVLLHPCILHPSLAKARALETSLSSSSLCFSLQYPCALKIPVFSNCAVAEFWYEDLYHNLDTQLQFQVWFSTFHHFLSSL